MSSDKVGSDGESRDSLRQILLSREQFEMIFQVTHQLPNYQEERLIGEGLTPQGLEFLIDLLGSLQGLAERCARIRLIVVDAPTVDALETSTVEATSGGNAGELEAVGRLPKDLAALWPQILQFASKSLGERELFLRTGYNAGEVRDTIAALSCLSARPGD